MLHCARCGLALPKGTRELVRLGVLAGDPPAPVALRADGPWPFVDLCRGCARVVAATIAESPMHRVGGGPPIEREEWQALKDAGRY
jgi:hypothetical protein